MTMSAPFALGGPLPQRRLVIEASAGTGKTHALSTLAARYVAEADVPIGELLVVTFTRAAAAELKDRVRERLVDFEALLAREELDDHLTSDQVAAAVWPSDPVEREKRRRRVSRAITDFDAATVTTIHGFAQQVLATLGSAVAADPEALLSDDADSLVVQVATDILVREAVSDAHPAAEIPTLDVLCGITSLALGNPGARLEPQPGDGSAGSAALLRRGLVDAVCAEVDRRRRGSATLSFDDLLVRLRDAVVDPGLRMAACEIIRQRYRVALIDEFQDTDPVQWQIFDAVFGRGATGSGCNDLVLVGDPKQAIYAFRGANVQTYLKAAYAPGTQRRSLDVNWRSDPAVLRSVELILRGATFGDDRIEFAPVQCAEKHAGRVLHATSAAGSRAVLPALSVRLVDGEGVPRRKTGDTRLALGEAERCVFEDLALHVRDLLETAVIPDSDAPAGERSLRPDDVAVLVSANREAAKVQQNLSRLSIPAVISRGENVLGSEAASQWHRLLSALARPSDRRRARAFAISWFGGHDGSWLAAATDEQVARIQEQLHAWGGLLAGRGVAALIGRVFSDTGVTGRVLAMADGDRAMTDLDHIGELLVVAAGQRLTPTALLDLYEQMSDGNDTGDPEADLAARRVESEARAVQIMTTFVAKGLEFPVVCCTSAWRPRGARSDHNVWWDDDAGVRAIDVATDLEWGDPATAARRQAASEAEAVGTNLRVLYVALTRARHHTALWWLPVENAAVTGLARVLFARDRTGKIDPDAFRAETVDLPHGTDALDRLAPLVAQGNGDLEVVLVDAQPSRPRPWAAPHGGKSEELAVATLDRQPSRDRKRWSFSAIVGAAGDHVVAVDPTDDTLGDGGAADEDIEAPDTAAPEAAGALDGAVLVLGDIAGGPGFGTLVHRVLEVVDFSSPTLRQDLTAAVDDALAWSPWPLDRERLVTGLEAAIGTPLGPLFAGRPLRDLAQTDRLDELDFDLALGLAGTPPTGPDLGALVLDHLAADDPLRGWAEQVAGGVFDVTLAGQLTGSIDLVARIRTDAEPDRFVVCDYKTNRLAPRGTDPTIDSFGPDRLALAMAAAHYPLQALLYSVAVHRYLRWRLRTQGYDPAVHLGGVGYLFVRGMIGPTTPAQAGAPHGLFEWHPPAELIVELSDLLDGRGRQRGPL